MEWLVPTLVAAGITVVVSFWGWLTLRVIAMDAKLVELEEKVNSRDHECETRLAWLREMDAKLDRNGQNIALICGNFGITPVGGE